MSPQTYKSNRHIVYSCKYHVVFCPKYRRKVLVDGVDVRLKEIIQQVADDLECEIIELEIMPDHVHILCEVDPHFGVHKFVKRVKGLSLCPKISWSIQVWSNGVVPFRKQFVRM